MRSRNLQIPKRHEVKSNARLSYCKYLDETSRINHNSKAASKSKCLQDLWCKKGSLVYSHTPSVKKTETKKIAASTKIFKWSFKETIAFLKRRSLVGKVSDELSHKMSWILSNEDAFWNIPMLSRLLITGTLGELVYGSTQANGHKQGLFYPTGQEKNVEWKRQKEEGNI